MLSWLSCFIHNPRRDDAYEIIFGETTILDLAAPPPLPEYNSQQYYNGIDHNNLALVRLDQPENYTDFVRPICLATMRNESEAYHGCVVAAWGNQSE